MFGSRTTLYGVGPMSAERVPIPDRPRPLSPRNWQYYEIETLRLVTIIINCWYFLLVFYIVFLQKYNKPLKGMAPPPNRYSMLLAVPLPWRCSYALLCFRFQTQIQDPHSLKSFRSKKYAEHSLLFKAFCRYKKYRIICLIRNETIHIHIRDSFSRVWWSLGLMSRSRDL